MAYFYCSATSGRPDPTTACEILRCIVRQLALSRDGLSIRAAVIECFESKREYEGGREPERLSILECVRLIPALVEDHSPCFIILDALDELKREEGEKLLDAFEMINSRSVTPLKIFVTSRIPFRSANTSAGEISLELQVSNERDLRMYVATEVGKAIKQRRLLKGDVSAELQLAIVDNLHHHARGM